MTQRRFIQEITQKLPSNVDVSFINKKGPVRRLEAFHLDVKIIPDDDETKLPNGFIYIYQ